MEVRPDVILTNQRHCLVSPEVSRYYVEYLELKIITLGNVDSAIESEETIVGVHPSWVARVSKVFLSYGVRFQVSYDIGMKLFGVHDDTCSECW